MPSALRRCCMPLTALAVAVLMSACGQSAQSPTSTATNAEAPLRVAISPYQDIAILVNVKNLGLEKKYGTQLELITLPWEDIPNAVASGGNAVDVGFIGLTDYMSKIENMNSTDKDPVVYLYPDYVFRGGGFVSFNRDVPVIDAHNVNDLSTVRKFLSYKIGVQRSSCFQMAIYVLAKRAGVKRSDLKLVDTTINDGLLAAENGSLDMSSAGLTQRTEAVKRHGRVVLTIDTMKIVDTDGFACKASTYKRRKKDLENLVRMWFDCTDYVLSDVDHHTAATLDYLKKNAATKYTLAEYKRTIAEEYFPRSVQEAERELVVPASKFSLYQQGTFIIDYLHDIGVRAPKSPPVPVLHFSTDSKSEASADK
jgi:ABC-type nitrate/sulfonate/bicarbonate transport system substrate-binding protein